MIFWVSIAVRHALQCVLVSAPELVTALNLHEMINGFFLHLVSSLSAISCTGHHRRQHNNPHHGASVAALS
jgi:hypothetical protein